MKTVLLHGLGQSIHDWDEVIARVTVSDLDCPALFAQTESGAVTYPRILADLETRYANTMEPFRICGLSLGAVLALDYTTRHIEQVDSLVLIAGQFKSPTLLVDLQNLIFRLMPQKMFQNTGISKDSMIQLTHSMRRLDLSAKLAQVTCPTTVVCGERDHTNLSASTRLAALLPQGTLYIVPGADHEINRSAPAVIAEILNK